jgi:hypothetical protein
VVSQKLNRVFPFPFAYKAGQPPVASSRFQKQAPATIRLKDLLWQTVPCLIFLESIDQSPA